MDKTEAMKKAEETLCRFAWLAEGKKQNATDYQRLEGAVATVLLSIDEQAEKRGYAKGVEAAARFADTHSWHGNREDGFRIESYEYPQEGLTALGDAIRALLTEPVGERSKLAPWTVKLTYFKPSGKCYTGSEYQSEHSELWRIFEEVTELARTRQLPGLIEGHSDWITLVEVPGHPHEHPFLVIPTTQGDESK